MKLDLTLKLSKEHPIWKRQQATQNRYFISGHIGTHIDIHLKTEISLDYINCNGIAFDVSDIEDRDVALTDFNYKLVQAGDFVFFRTGMIERQEYGSLEYFNNHTQLSQEVIDFLIKQRIKLIGIDAAGVRRGREHVIADKRCEQHGIYIIENLVQLNKLTQQTQSHFKTTMLWFEQPEQTGFPCRVVVDI